MASTEPPVIASADPPVIASADPPVIASADPPVMASTEPPVIALSLLSLVSATAAIGSANAISDAPRMPCILALLAVRIFPLLINYYFPTLLFMFIFDYQHPC
jgi:hypothetical protein